MKGKEESYSIRHVAPSGANITDEEIQECRAWRKENLRALRFPVEGFDHSYGEKIIREVDSRQLGSMDEDAPRNDETPQYEFGRTLTQDDAPVGSLRDKWRLLPHFLRLRSLLRQHIDSFDHFINVEMQQIVKSPSACEIRSDHDPKFYLRYEACWVGEPSIEEDSYDVRPSTPYHSRIRDNTYSAPIYVNVRYVRGKEIVVKRGVQIGRMPIMLRSQKCVLRDKTDDQLAQLKECPLDPVSFVPCKSIFN